MVMVSKYVSDDILWAEGANSAPSALIVFVFYTENVYKWKCKI